MRFASKASRGSEKRAALNVGIMASFALASTFCTGVLAQTPSTTILTIEMENVVQYQESFANPQKNGSSAAMEAPITSPATFFPGTFIADIVAVNGKKVKGTTIGRNYWVGVNTNPSGSQGIADVNRFQAMEIFVEILQADGSALGSIALTGLTGGAGPVGAPKSGVTGNFTVLGGTGAFMGARGQAATIMNSHRASSTLENPINRRTFSSGLWKMVIQLIPMQTPEVLIEGSAPVVLHASDYTIVSPANPAHAGEILTTVASGLGATRPGVDPGQAFPDGSAQPVIIPLDVLVNGKVAELLYAGGYPNTVNNYQVNFRVPGDTAPGLATLQLSAAWVNGTVIRVPVQ